jgi:hypothetical protein
LTIQKDSLGLFQLMGVKEVATTILCRKTDIMTRRSLHPALGVRIEDSALKFPDAPAHAGKTLILHNS